MSGSPVAAGRVPATADLLEDMRRETAASHARLEERLGLLAPDSTLDRYVQFLQATFDVVSGLDGALLSFLGDTYALPGHESRVERLEHDLEALAGGAMRNTTIELPPVTTPAAAFGAGYVVQGSLLGGAVIVRHLRERFALGDAGTRYLHGYGDGLGPAWRRFTQALNEYGHRASTGSRHLAIDTASQTFMAFEQAWRCRAPGPA